MQSMNIFQKLQKIRCELQSTDLKKSGSNKFAGYQYFELGDFLPTINTLCDKYQLGHYISYTNELATLILVNAEKLDEFISITSPMSEASLKGCHPIQNLGAVETYSRRYLYMTAFEIVEHDAIDASVKEEKPKNKEEFVKKYPLELISDAQVKRLYSIAKGNENIAKEVLKGMNYNSAKEIHTVNYEAIVEEIQTKIQEVNK